MAVVSSIIRLTILRHGDAPFNHSSGERALSELGRAQTEQVVRQRIEELSTTSLIICSPSRRARETLAIASKTLGYTGELLFDDCLRSESSISAVGQRFNSIEADNVLLVSHQPLVGTMIDYLTDQRGYGMAMGTSCLACLDLITFSRGCGTLNWLDSPS